MKTNIILLFACAVLCSCAELGKFKPQTEVSNTLYGDVALSGEESNLAKVGWKEFFKDTLLQNYIAQAIEGNKDLMLAAERTRSSKAAIAGARMAFFPSLSLTPSYSGKYAQKSYAGDYSVAAPVSWQLSIFRKANNLKFAVTNSALMEDYRQAVLSDLVANVANAYYSLLMLDSQMATAKQMLSNWEQSFDMSKALKEAGIADQVAVSQYEANLENIRITVMDLDRQIKICENSICILLGKEVGQKIVRGSLDAQEAPETLSVGVPVQMLALRPDVRAAQREVEVAFYAQRGALLNFFPALSITGALGLLNPFTGAISSMDLLGEVSASLVAPIFTSGTNRSQYEKAKSNQIQARITFDKTLLEAGKEVNEAMNEYVTRSQMAQSYDVRVGALDKAREDTEYLMKNSLDKTYLDVLYANTTFFDAKLALIENQARCLQAAVSLYAALGGGVIQN